MRLEITVMIKWRINNLQCLNYISSLWILLFWFVLFCLLWGSNLFIVQKKRGEKKQEKTCYPPFLDGCVREPWRGGLLSAFPWPSLSVCLSVISHSLAPHEKAQLYVSLSLADWLMLLLLQEEEEVTIFSLRPKYFMTLSLCCENPNLLGFSYSFLYLLGFSYSFLYLLGFSYSFLYLPTY